MLDRDRATPDSNRIGSAAGSTGGGRDASEPWDPQSAEALAQAYEAVAASPSQSLEARPDRSVLGPRLAEISSRIMRTLQEMRPQSTLTALEARFDAFEARIEAAVKDLAKRSDLNGLSQIEGNIDELGGRVAFVQSELKRLDSLDVRLRTVSEQLSDERLSGLMAYDNRFAADLAQVARTAAEETWSKLAAADGGAEAQSRRHEELKALIEAAMSERRHGSDQINAVAADLGGAMNAQAERSDELRSLIDASITEQRRNDEQFVTMLDTLQQALIQVLDRMDAFEGAAFAAPAAETLAAVEDHEAVATEHEPAAHEPLVDLDFDDPETDVVAYPGGFRQSQTDQLTMAYADAAESAPVATTDPLAPTDEPISAVDRMRRDFLADAHRAKAKVSARAADDSTPARGAGSRFQFLARKAGSSGGFAGRLFGLSPKLLGLGLALIVAINGGLLLFSGGDEPAAVQTQSGDASEPAASSRAKSAEHGSPPGRTDGGARDASGDRRSSLRSSSGADGEASSVLASVPQGLTLQTSRVPPPDEDLAMLYEQQMLAGMSGDLGATVAKASLSDLLPEGAQGPSGPDGADRSQAAGDNRVGALDLPPATVGPLSLRLAAANGDPSAEFEVGARLAEGKGTQQNFAEALRWYQRSAGQGFAQAQYRLGTLYERGLGIEADLSRARVWYQRSAEQGNVKAMHNLAVLSAGTDQGGPDYATAAKWFQAAADSGLADSQYNLAVLLENGLGVEMSTEAAFKWYSLAANGGDGEAVKRRDELRAVMSKDELAAAEDMIASFSAKPWNALVNDPRAAGEDWKRRQAGESNG